jgi:hypothetical protein
MFSRLWIWAAFGVLALSQVGCRTNETPAAGPATHSESQPYVAQDEPEEQAEPVEEPSETAVDATPPVEEATIEPAEVVADTSPPASPGTTGAEIEMGKLVHDWGEIGPETTQTATFSFTNVGDETLTIKRVRKCCGTITRGVEDGQEYAPGETGTLVVEYVAGSYPGSMRRNLHLETDAPGQKFITLTIKATIVQRVEYDPKRLRLFYKQKNAGCADITLKSVDGRPFSVTGFRSTADALTAEINPETKATEIVIEPTADLEKLKRNPKGEVRITLTHPECRVVRMLYDVLPEFTVSPPQLLLFNLRPEQPETREIWILSNYADDFEIESVESQKGTVRLIESKKVEGAPRAGDTSRPQPGTRYQLKVEVTPPALDGENTVLSDVLEVRVKGYDPLEILCRGFY